MPFVRISLRDDTPRETRRSISKGIHRALVDAIGIPEGDRFHVIGMHSAEDMLYDSSYMGIEYQNVVFIEITFVQGRSEEKKLNLYRAITDNLVAGTGMRSQDVVIVLTENDRANWSIGNGEAQLLNLPPRT
ncbi:MAG: tautomerase family protein [Acidobacteriota bacterium]|nr:tautomerase family protein [Acidobacteriota bacterium]